MTKLSDLDLEVMEVLALRVPWYMICGEYHRRYGSPGALARRLFELQTAGLIEIRTRDDTAPRATAEILEADAIANDCYDDLESSSEPAWDVTATETGFELISDRLGRE